MKEIRFGLIGAGQIAHHSAQEIARHTQGKIVAAQDLDETRVRELCDAHRIPHAYRTAQELFANPEVDAVSIAVPNKFHVPLAIEAMKAGKHVLLEKPFAMNYQEAKEAAEVAQKTGKVLMIGMNQRFANPHQQIKALVESGNLGEIYHAKAYWYRRTGIPKLGTWFGNRALAGAGCLYDIGVHMLDLCLYLMDNFKPVSVSGSTYTKFGNRGLGEGGWGKSDRSDIPFDVDDFASGLIRFENGATVSLDVAWACHMPSGNENDVKLFGTEGGASAVEGRYFKPDPTTGEYRVHQDLKFKVRYPHHSRFHNFINHLTTGEALAVTIEQALAVQKILDAMAESSSTGREVKLV